LSISSKMFLDSFRPVLKVKSIEALPSSRNIPIGKVSLQDMITDWFWDTSWHTIFHLFSIATGKKYTISWKRYPRPEIQSI
jgi:hypothetical protein